MQFFVAALCGAFFRVVATGAALMAPALAGHAQALPPRAEAPPVTITLSQAEFRAEGSTAWQPVSLPDTWALRGQAAADLGSAPAGHGHYRLHFTLPEAVQQVWAVDAERLSPAHEVRLNGLLVHGSLQGMPPLKRAQHTLIALPPHLLQAGRNTLEISLSAGASGGLSPLLLGPVEDLDGDFRRSQLRTVALPQMANIAAAGVSLFMLLLWWRRRSEAAIGSFGALCLLASVRNYGYFATAAPLPPAWSSWLFMLAALLTMLLLAVFAMAVAGRRPPWLVRALWATGVLFPLLSLAALGAGALQTARLWLYPVLLLLVLPSLALLLQAAWHKRSAPEITLVASLAGVLGAGVHDYLYQQGRLSIMGTFWLPYAVPVVVAVFSTLLLRRLLSSLETVERLNVTLEAKVAERTQELQAANAAKSRFLAAASHDLRQPMVSIGLMVGLMEAGAASGPLKPVVQRLKQATGAMETLLTRLLDLSRLQSGSLLVQRQPMALQPLFDALDMQHAELARRKGLALRLRPSAAVVQGDPVLLQQIMGNLLGNAVRYTAAGGVLVAARPAGPRHWRVAVWDTGPGIAASEQDSIFGEFVRGAATDGSGPQGAGLGLAIAQRAAALLGTRVALRSQPGRGSCFSVLLPRATLPAAGPAAAADPVPPSAIEPRPLRGRLIWLLEDDAEVRASLQLMLEHWGAAVQGHETLAAMMGRLALGPAADPGPDLLITDLHLPDGLGTQALAACGQRWPGRPLLAMTARTDVHDLAELAPWRDSGVAVLAKPFASTALLAAVLAALGGTAEPRA